MHCLSVFDNFVKLAPKGLTCKWDFMNLVNADFYNCSDLQQQEEDHLLFLTNSKIRIDEKIILRISNLHKIYGKTATGYLSPFSLTTTT